MYFIPTEAAVEKVMREMGMDRLQAIWRLQQEAKLRARPDPYPLGKSNSVDHDAEYAAWAAKYPELAARHN